MLRSYAFFRQVFDDVAADFPEIERDYAYVDAMPLWQVQRPGFYDVAVAENMFGDIISDLGAGAWRHPATSGLLYLGITRKVDPLIAAQRVATGIDSFTLLAIPFFMLAGDIMNRAGITGKIFPTG